MIYADIVIWNQIVSALEWLLNHYHDALGSWGWSIVLLTFTIRLAMLPLTIRQFRSMVAMQVVQPANRSLANALGIPTRGLRPLRPTRDVPLQPQDPCRFATLRGDRSLGRPPSSLDGVLGPRRPQPRGEA